MNQQVTFLKHGYDHHITCALNCFSYTNYSYLNVTLQNSLSSFTQSTFLEL